MKTMIIQTIRLLKRNWKTLLLFETIYRLFGVALLFPLANQLLNLSVLITGNRYIINEQLFAYVQSPYTILIFIVILLLVGIYIVYEIVALTILFHSSYNDKTIDIQTLFFASFKRFISTIKRYHISIIISSSVFLILVEGFHIVGIASTMQLPSILINEIETFPFILPVSIVFTLMLITLFIETIYFEIQCIVKQKPLKENLQTSRSILHHKRLKLLGEFLLINGIINGIIYVLYALLLGLIAVVLFLFSVDGFAFPYLLSILYSLYVIIGFIATIILIPINFAWINIRYYSQTNANNIALLKEMQKEQKQPRLRKPIFRRLMIAVYSILIIIIVVSVTFISNDQSRLELFNNPEIISHRGGGFYAPENTLSSIETGMDYGADAIEIDIRFTKDGIPVLMHDKTLGRTTNDSLNRNVGDLTYSELQRLDAGSWFGEEYVGEPVPTLEEALTTARFRTTLFIEIKAITPGGEATIVDLIESYNMVYSVKILSFNETVLQNIKALNDNIDTVLLLAYFVGDIDNLANNDAIDYYAIRFQIAIHEEDKIHRLMQRGKGVYVWTVNSGSEMSEANDLGIDGIITDYPLVTREIVYQDSTRSVYTSLLRRLFTRN